MSELPATWMWTKAEQGTALLARLTIEQEAVRHGCNCQVGYLPPYEGRFGLVFPPDPVRLYRSMEESRMAIVLRYLGIPAGELGLEPVKIAWSSLKRPVRRAIDRVSWVICQDYHECGPSVANDPEMAALLGAIA